MEIMETDKSNFKRTKEKMSGFSKSMIQCAQKLVEVDERCAADGFDPYHKEGETMLQ